MDEDEILEIIDNMKMYYMEFGEYIGEMVICVDDLRDEIKERFKKIKDED